MLKKHEVSFSRSGFFIVSATYVNWYIYKAKHIRLNRRCDAKNTNNSLVTLTTNVKFFQNKHETLLTNQKRIKGQPQPDLNVIRWTKSLKTIQHHKSHARHSGAVSAVAHTFL